MIWDKIGIHILFGSDIFAFRLLANNALHHKNLKIASFIGVCRYPYYNSLKD